MKNNASSIETYAKRTPSDKRLEGRKRIRDYSAPCKYENQPLVSIITVVRNGEKYIEKTIQSVLNQDYPNIEYIVIDGASTDNTLNIIKKYEQSVDYWLSEPDGGIYDAMNKGIDLAKGELIKLLNADDMLPSDSVSCAVTFFKDAGNNKCIIMGNIELIDKNDNRIDIWKKGFLHPSWYVSKQIYEQIGFYNTHFKVSADYEYFLRLQHAKIRFIQTDEVLIKFRWGGTSLNFTGVFEGFTIDLKYKGIINSIYLAFGRFYKKSRYWLLRLIIGEQYANRIYAKMKYFRYLLKHKEIN
jgi:glycosyltransferase involved in cell wall biosynthesis